MRSETPTLSVQSSAADEINRLHQDTVKSCAVSREALGAALAAAWKAGQLLVVEKQRVRRVMGPGAWKLWLERYFSGTPRTAQRYMLLARSVTDPSFLTDMSLRQAYFRLGIATEPKSPVRAGALRPIPRHATLAVRLLGLLEAKTDRLSPELRRAYQLDLRPLYERLRSLFEPAHR